jgi:hypothetical protein
MASVYQINKGINTSLEFKGLRAQYIWYFGAMLLVLLILFAILYIIGVPGYICLVLIGSSGGYGSFRLFAISHQYGEHGLMKMAAKKRVPKVLKAYNRKLFQNLSEGSWKGI